ncbi:hypothetical protein FQA39_LY04936 [Lamprigera yunnana]|nr:hypothetical protein FQA39_LY04936 [Lamprigera yunnana]
MDLVLKYDKSYQERLNEYMGVFGNEEALPSSGLMQEWSFYLDGEIDLNGWQAIWKISRNSCADLNIEYPTLVLVYVTGICLPKIMADIKILKVQDEIDLPKSCTVRLTELHPTIEQDDSISLNLSSTAHAIDMIRFFYTHLFFPWDMEEDGANWFSKHLRSRLHLYYDLRNGEIPDCIATKIIGSISNARHIYECCERTISTMEKSIDLANCENPVSQKVFDLRVQLMQIRNEVELFEDPNLRKFVIKDRMEKCKNKTHQTTWVVCEQGDYYSILSFFNDIREVVGDIKVRFEPTFVLVLDQVQTNDTVFLNGAEHLFSGLSALHEGGRIKGVVSRSTTLKSTDDDIVLDCQGKIFLENLIIDVGDAHCGLLVRRGAIVTLSNCVITGNYNSSIQQGIIVLSGGTLYIIESEICGFYTGMVVNSNAVLSLNDSKIYNVNCGLKCYSGCDIKMKATFFEDCTSFGICMETNNEELAKVGDFKLLNTMDKITTKNVIGKNIGKGYVKINYKHKLEPVRDLFSNPVFHHILILDNDKIEDPEMETAGVETTLDDANEN